MDGPVHFRRNDGNDLPFAELPPCSGGSRSTNSQVACDRLLLQGSGHGNGAVGLRLGRQGCLLSYLAAPFPFLSPWMKAVHFLLAEMRIRRV